MERAMVRVLELRFGQPFVIVHCAVPDELYLWYTRNSLEIRVEDGILRFAGLVVAMTVRLGGGVERLICPAVSKELRRRSWYRVGLDYTPL